MIAVEKLTALRLFRDASPEALSPLAANMTERRYPAGETILQEGEVTGTLFVVASGIVRVEKRLDTGSDRHKIIARLEADEIFGEMAFLENQPHSASVTAQADTVIYALPRHALDDLCKKNAPLALSQVLMLLSGVSARLRRTTQELVTVFEVARAVASPLSVEALTERVLGLMAGALADGASAAFYRWNPFNDEYQLVGGSGPGRTSFAAVIEPTSPFLSEAAGHMGSWPNMAQSAPAGAPFRSGHMVSSPSNMDDSSEGLFLYHHPTPVGFDAGARQMMETVSAILAPALVAVRAREEAAARERREQGRQAPYGL